MSGMTFSSSAVDFDELFTQAMTLTQDLLNSIFLDLNAIQDFHSSQEYHWNNHLILLTTDLSRFVELTSLLSKLLYKKKHLRLEAIRESHIHLLYVLKGINQAQLKKDTWILEDLIKHELKDNLTQWKIDFIPHLKRMMN
jgi:hypothetical protein